MPKPKLDAAQFAPHDRCPDCWSGTMWPPTGTQSERPGRGRRLTYRCGDCDHRWSCWWSYFCFDCGSHEDLTVDHIWPRALGGTDTAENLRILCRSCNARKGAKPTHACPTCSRHWDLSEAA